MFLRCCVWVLVRWSQQRPDPGVCLGDQSDGVTASRHSARHLRSCPSQSDGPRADPSKEMSQIGQASNDLPNFEDKYFEHFQECEVCR